MELFYELNYRQLVQWLAARGERRYRADQVFQWVYHRGVTDFTQMTNVPSPLRQALAAQFTLTWPRIMKSTGQPTTKHLLEYPDGVRVECVSIPMDSYYTFCLSSQVGCAMGCRFCASAQGGLQRNLTAGEIAAIKRLTDTHILGLSPRHITVSTAGLVPGIYRLADMDLRVELAVSLNAVTDSQRRELMPGAARWSIAQLLAACRYFTQKTEGQPVTFEYVLMAGINDSLEEADRLARLVGDLRHHVNLIPFNPVNHADFRRPTPKHVEQFCTQLRHQGINASVRYSKGTEVAAACGQLRVDVDS